MQSHITGIPKELDIIIIIIIIIKDIYIAPFRHAPKAPIENIREDTDTRKIRFEEAKAIVYSMTQPSGDV